MSALEQLDWGNKRLTPFIEAQAPDMISWLPQTLGWKIVVLVVILYLVANLWRKVSLYKANAYRRAALFWIEHISLEPVKDYSNSSSITELPSLLRKVALQLVEREAVSHLTGVEWEKWLDERCLGAKFSTQFAGMLDTLSYQPKGMLSDEQLLQLIDHVRYWVMHHRGRND